LIAFRGGGIDFSVRDRLGADKVSQRQRRDQRRLAVLSGDGEDGPSNQPAAVLRDRVVDVPDEPFLPVAQLERLALSFA
jgi:hypothetical protein